MKIERSDDPVWHERGRRLLEYLSEPRTWSDLVRWSRSSGLAGERLRHTLAHVDTLFVVNRNRNKQLTWVRRGIATKYMEDQDDEDNSAVNE